MRIDEVRATAFGPFRSERLALSPGLNVIHGPNEAGKSSWFAATYAGLVGRRRSRGRGTAAQAQFSQRHKPWAGSQWAAGVTITLDDGTTLALEHDLRKGEGRMVDIASGRVIPVDAAERRLGRPLETEGALDGARILGLNRENVRATIFVAQADVLRVMHDADELQELVERVASSGAADVTAEAALQWLARTRSERVGVAHIGNRPLRQSTLALEQARTAAHGARDRLGELQHVMTQQRDAQTRLDEAVTRLASLGRARQMHEAVELRGRVEQARRLTAEVSCDAHPPADDTVVRRVTVVLGAFEQRVAAPPPLEGPDSIVLRAQLDALPAAPAGDLEPRADVQQARDALNEARASARTHARSAGDTVTVPQTEATAAELRRLADQLTRVSPDVDPALERRLAMAKDAHARSVSVFEVAENAHRAAVEHQQQRRLDYDAGIAAYRAEQERYAAELQGWEAVVADLARQEAEWTATDHAVRQAADAARVAADRAAEERLAAQQLAVAQASTARQEAAEAQAASAAARSRSRGALAAAGVLVVLGIVLFALGQIIAGAALLAIGAVAAATGLLMGRSHGDSAATPFAPSSENVVQWVPAPPTAVPPTPAMPVPAPRPRPGPAPARPVPPAPLDAPDFAALVAPARPVPDPAIAESEAELAGQRALLAAHAQDLADAAARLTELRLPADAVQLHTIARALDDADAARSRADEHAKRARQLDEGRREAAGDLATALGLTLPQPDDDERDEAALAAYDVYVDACRLRAEQAAAAAGRGAALQVLEQRQEIERAYEQAMANRVAQEAEIVAVAAQVVAGGEAADPDAAAIALRRWSEEQQERRDRIADAREQGGRLEQLLDGRKLTDLEAELEAAQASLGPDPEPVPPDLDEQVTRWTKHHEGLLGTVGDLRGRHAQLVSGLPAVALVLEREAEAARASDAVKELAQALDAANVQLELAKQRSHSSVAPALEQQIRPWVPAITQGRYLDVKVNPADLTMQVTEANGALRDAHLLSHGTTEQLYVLLRIALAQHLASTVETAPLILDDVTVHSDVVRTRAVLDLLHRVSAERQVVIFTQEDEVVAWAQEHLVADTDRLTGLTLR